MPQWSRPTGRRSYSDRRTAHSAREAPVNTPELTRLDPSFDPPLETAGGHRAQQLPTQVLAPRPEATRSKLDAEPIVVQTADPKHATVMHHRMQRQLAELHRKPVEEVEDAVLRNVERLLGAKWGAVHRTLGA